MIKVGDKIEFLGNKDWVSYFKIKEMIVGKIYVCIKVNKDGVISVKNIHNETINLLKGEWKLHKRSVYL